MLLVHPLCVEKKLNNKNGKAHVINSSYNLGRGGFFTMSNFRRIDSFKMYIMLSFTTQFLFTLIFTVNLLYQLKVVGLNPLQLVLVGTVLELTVFLFEIPTGLVADVKSRKLSIIIGYLLI